MSNLTSSLTIKLIDDVSKPARTVAQALKDAERNAKSVAQAMNGAGATNRLQVGLAKLSLSAKDIERVAGAWKDYARSAGLASNAAQWTKSQAADVRRWETQTIAALRKVTAEQRRFASASTASRGASGGGGHEGGMSGRQVAAGIAGAYAAHKAAHFGREALHTYREFDKERRFAKAVMGISDSEQAPLVQQAIHGGATSKYNDIQWLEAQRELAARGLKREQILGMTPAAATLGQSLDLSLPDAVKQMEGAIFGFKKPIATLEEAIASAKQTADLQVKAAKVSGMTPEDISQAYKYGATPARMSGVSESTLLAFAAISKKANMGGDESGVAFRALMAAAQSPTRAGREAMAAKGIRFADFQKKADSLPLQPFVEQVASQYGVKLNKSAQAALGKVFGDKETIRDPSKFTPAVLNALQGTLGKQDLKSKKSIAGMANRMRTASMEGVDTNALLVALMKAIPGNLQLANAIFGSKQGGRIATALGDPETLKHLIEEIQNQSGGYAEKISKERMEGFDGAVSRFEGAIKNLETAVGRAFDQDGRGGLLTNVTNTVGQVIQSLAELPASAIRATTALTALGAAFAGWKGLEALMGGFGLKASATALTGAAEALTAAAGKMSVGSTAGAAGATAGKTAGAVAAGSAAVLAAPAAIVAGAALLAAGKDQPEEIVKARAEMAELTKRMATLDSLIAGGHAGPKTQEKRDAAQARFDKLKVAVDASDVEALKPKADAAKTAVDQLNTTVTPTVATAGIDAAIVKAQQLIGLLGRVGALASGAGAQISSLGKIQRGQFSTAGVQGE